MELRCRLPSHRSCCHYMVLASKQLIAIDSVRVLGITTVRHLVNYTDKWSGKEWVYC